MSVFSQYRAALILSFMTATFLKRYFYLPHSDSPSEAHTHTCQPETETAADLRSGKCCAKTRCSSLLAVGSCPDLLGSVLGWKCLLQDYACSWWNLGKKEQNHVRSSFMTDEALEESHTINTQHHVTLVLRTRLKLVNDHFAVLFGHIYHLEKKRTSQNIKTTVQVAVYLTNNYVAMRKLNHTSLLLAF